MALVLTDDTHYKNIAKEIRDNLPDEYAAVTFTPAEMPDGVAEVSDYQNELGYSVGFQEGYDDGFTVGERSEYDRFWNVLQNNGDPAGVNYYYHFSYGGWTDENFNPKHPIICATGTTPGMALFYANKAITDTKVPIEVLGSSAQSMFATAQNLVTIRKLIVHNGVSFNSTFNGCYALKNLTIEGVIGKDSVNLEHSYLLSKASIESVVNALSTTTSGLSVTFSKQAVDREFTDEEWATLANTRPNWTINLV